MQRQLLTALSLVVAMVEIGCMSTESPSDEISSLTYQGETIQLSRTYPDFEAYKDDPDNLPVAELPRVARLVKAAPLRQRFDTREEANDFLFDLMFPGYGLSMLQLDKPVALFSLEVPRMDEDRWVTLIQKDGKWVVVDDFVWPIAKGYIRAAELKDGRIEYLDRDGATLHATPLHESN